MDWIQVFVILGTILGFLTPFMLWLFNKLDTDIKKVSSDLTSWIQILSKRMEEQSLRMDQQSQRMDHLMTHIAELVKSRKI